MDEAGIQFRLAASEDVAQIRESIRFTLANPEGRAQRKKYEDAVARSEMLVLTRYESRERSSKVVGFVEWHTKVDDSVTIRDAGTTGDAPQVPILKRLVKEMLRLLNPPEATVKIRSDQATWISVFQETPGFIIDGREFSRPHYREIYKWTVENERLSARIQRPTYAPPPRRRR